jgi:hypothetical protein
VPEDTLILKRDPDTRYTESYNVLFEGRHVGRIYKAVSHAPRESPLLLSPSGLDLQALVGYDTTAKQAAVLGVCRATAWVVLNRDKRAGPSAKVIKRILSSPTVPPSVRRKNEEYIEDRIRR